MAYSWRGVLTMTKARLHSLVLSIVVALVGLVGLSGVTNAAVAEGCSNSFLGFPTWYQYLNVTKDASGSCSVDTASTQGSTAVLLLMGIFDILLYLAGMLAVVFIIYGGFKLLTSTGEPGKITAARTTIFNALIGLVIAFVASQIVGFIAGKLT